MQLETPLDGELRTLEAHTRAFVQKELIPREQSMEEAGSADPEALRRLKEMGYYGVRIPKEYGGLGLGVSEYVVILKEISKGHHYLLDELLTSNGIGSRSLIISGTEQQRENYLPKLASGELICAFALTEPGAGSDAGSIQTNAVPGGDGWVINGTKHFIGHGDYSDILTVMAVTDRSKGTRGGITAFIVEKGTPGFKPARVQQNMGGVHVAELVVDDCWVPASSVIGKVGEGFKLAMETLDEGRMHVASMSIGMAERALQIAIDYAKVRVQFGQPIANFQGVQWLIADSLTELYAATVMTLQVAAEIDSGAKVPQKSAMTKYFASEMVGRVADRALQVLGGTGYMKEMPVERIYRFARLQRIVDGTSEIMKMLIARGALR